MPSKLAGPDASARVRSAPVVGEVVKQRGRACQWAPRRRHDGRGKTAACLDEAKAVRGEVEDSVGSNGGDKNQIEKTAKRKDEATAARGEVAALRHDLGSLDVDMRKSLWWACRQGGDDFKQMFKGVAKRTRAAQAEDAEAALKRLCLTWRDTLRTGEVQYVLKGYYREQVEEDVQKTVEWLDKQEGVEQWVCQQKLREFEAMVDLMLEGTSSSRAVAIGTDEFKVHTFEARLALKFYGLELRDAMLTDDVRGALEIDERRLMHNMCREVVQWLDEVVRADGAMLKEKLRRMRCMADPMPEGVWERLGSARMAVA